MLNVNMKLLNFLFNKHVPGVKMLWMFRVLIDLRERNHNKIITIHDQRLGDTLHKVKFWSKVSQPYGLTNGFITSHIFYFHRWSDCNWLFDTSPWKNSYIQHKNISWCGFMVIWTTTKIRIRIALSPQADQTSYKWVNALWCPSDAS